VPPIFGSCAWTAVPRQQARAKLNTIFFNIVDVFLPNKANNFFCENSGLRPIKIRVGGCSHGLNHGRKAKLATAID
jgi:hypothetical protein